MDIIIVIKKQFFLYAVITVHISLCQTQTTSHLVNCLNLKFTQKYIKQLRLPSTYSAKHLALNKTVNVKTFVKNNFNTFVTIAATVAVCGAIYQIWRICFPEPTGSVNYSTCTTELGPIEVDPHIDLYAVEYDDWRNEIVHFYDQDKYKQANVNQQQKELLFLKCLNHWHTHWTSTLKCLPYRDLITSSQHLTHIKIGDMASFNIGFEMSYITFYLYKPYMAIFFQILPLWLSEEIEKDKLKDERYIKRLSERKRTLCRLLQPHEVDPDHIDGMIHVIDQFKHPESGGKIRSIMNQIVETEDFYKKVKSVPDDQRQTTDPLSLVEYRYALVHLRRY